MNNIDELRRIAIFAAVVDTGSFTAAAERLGMAKSAVSRQVSLLEDHLGAPLLARTTRRLSLTDAGRSFHARAARMVAEAETALAEVRGLTARPMGLLRVSAPQQLGANEVATAIHGFQQQHPQVDIELVLDDAYVDLVAANIDVAVRVGRLRDSALVARKLADAEIALCASPALVERVGMPTHHDHLAGLPWIVYTLGRAPHRQPAFAPDGRRVTLRTHGPLRTNSGTATVALVRAGAGIAAMPRFYVDDDLAAGRLVRLLPDYRFEPLHIQAVFVAGRDLLPKVRLFVDHLGACLRGC